MQNPLNFTLVDQLSQQSKLIGQLRLENSQLKEKQQELLQRIQELEKLQGNQEDRIPTKLEKIKFIKSRSQNLKQMERESSYQEQQIDSSLQPMNKSPKKYVFQNSPQDYMVKEETNLQNVPLDDDMQSFLLAQQLQNEEEKQFNNRLMMMQHQFNTDEMDYDQLTELQERIGFVPKGFSNDQIKFILKKYLITESNDHDCTICFSNNTNVLLPCNHTFHHECLESWFPHQKVCPLCKLEIQNQ